MGQRLACRWCEKTSLSDANGVWDEHVYYNSRDTPRLGQLNVSNLLQIIVLITGLPAFPYSIVSYNIVNRHFPDWHVWCANRENRPFFSSCAMKRTISVLTLSVAYIVRRSSGVTSLLASRPSVGLKLTMASSSVRNLHSLPTNDVTLPIQLTETDQSRVQFSPSAFSENVNAQQANRQGTFSTSRQQSRFRAPNGIQSAPQSRRPSSVTTTGGTLRRRITKSETIRAYHVPTGSNWEPGAEPGIDTTKEGQEEHMLHEVSYLRI